LTREVVAADVEEYVAVAGAEVVVVVAVVVGGIVESGLVDDPLQSARRRSERTMPGHPLIVSPTVPPILVRIDGGVEFVNR
jgi:hypothetical protein